MPRPPLPKYSSPEVSAFHPAFEYAINEALRSKSNAGITVKHHYWSASTQIDFVLLDSSDRVILPIEIKRTRSDLRGAGRRQARDYWSNLGANGREPYYCASNLEIVELFKSDPSRLTTSAQLLKLSTSHTGLLANANENDFYSKLILCLAEVLDIVQGRQIPVFAGGLQVFQDAVGSALGDQSRWHKLFVPTCYEYIRGAATVINNLSHGWRSASFYQSQPSRLNDFGGAIDFQHVFCEPSPDPNDRSAFNDASLTSAYESGKALGSGDDIAELVNELLAPRAVGAVETDVDLAQLLGIVAKAALGRDLLECEEIFDPACGSGSLLAALPITAFPLLAPAQIRANEKEELFAEALSLRLGLAFAQTISPTNAPRITISGIESLTKADLQKVRIVVMNPPFLSGVAAADLKRVFVDRIQSVTGSQSRLNGGQIALEALFLELVWDLVEDGTIIATIFPTQHLYRGSSAVAKLRSFIAGHFALTHLVMYPRKGLFDSVIKQTVVLVGVKGQPTETVNIIEIEKPLADIDLAGLARYLYTGDQQGAHGVSVKTVQRAQLVSSTDRGWKGIVGAGQTIKDFLDQHMKRYSLLGALPRNQLTRGRVGNSGNTGLTVFDGSSPHYPSVAKLIPDNWLKPVLNTTDTMPRQLTKASAPEMSFQPPDRAYDPGSLDNAALKDVVREYIERLQPSRGVQPRRSPNVSMIIDALQRDQRPLGSGWVLVQRASRTKGEIGLLEEEGVLLSTNVLVVKLPSIEERRLLASWLLSVFGQVQLELYSTPQEGMRKLEIGALKKVAYPDLSGIDGNRKQKLMANFEREPAISFSNIASRDSDELWAEVVDPNYPEECLAGAFSLFKALVDERRGFG